MASELPDCNRLDYVDLELTDTERAELVSRIAEDGPGAIDKFVSEHRTRKSSIAGAIEKLRALLDQQGRRMREDLDEEYRAKMKAEREKLARGATAVDDDMDRTRKRRQKLVEDLGDVLQQALLADPLINIVAQAPPVEITPLSFWGRLGERVREFLAAIAAAFRRFWDWLTKRRHTKTARRRDGGPSLLIAFPSLKGTISGLDARFEGALMTSPDLRKGIEAGITKDAGFFSRLRLKLGARFGRGLPSSQARKAFRERVAELLSRRRKEALNEQDALDRRIKELGEHRKALGKGLDDKEKELQSQKDRLLQDMGRRLDADPEKRVREKVEEDLARSGLISRDSSGTLKITARLIDRFAELVLAGEIRNLPTRFRVSFGRTGPFRGSYERDRMRTVDEASRMDVSESLLTALLAHPSDGYIRDEDVLVNREITGTTMHVVLAFDKSSSMDENNRIVAAKKAVLALFKAVKMQDRRNVVDLVGFDTSVRPLDLVQVWESRPGGFTNTGSAIKVARELVEANVADTNVIYLITDGLPEAYTEGDRDIAGDNKRSLEYALEQARELRRLPGVRLVHILLEPDEEQFVEAARRIADAAKGRLITTDPSKLAAEMLVDYTIA